MLINYLQILIESSLPLGKGPSLYETNWKLGFSY